LILYLFGQQEEIQEITGMMRMGLWNQLNGRSAIVTKCKSLCNNNKGRRSIESIVRQTTEGWTNSRIKIKIYYTMLLYSKEG